MKNVPIIGRILFALVFLMSGFNHLANLNAMSGYAASKGVPLPTAMTLLSGILIILGGLSVLLGYKAKIGAAALAVFLIVTAFVMHGFWAYEGQQMQNEMSHFLKDIALAGASLLIMYFGTGPKSLEDQSTEESDTGL